ncbi:hypothetical protein D477_020578, partial [Arthrobacter crystallopoietes BAB-32]
MERKLNQVMTSRRCSRVGLSVIEKAVAFPARYAALKPAHRRAQRLFRVHVACHRFTYDGEQAAADLLFRWVWCGGGPGFRGLSTRLRRRSAR